MKILLIHNKYLNFSGEEAVFEAQLNLLESNGHEAITYVRSSQEIGKMKFGKIKAFLSAFNNNRVKKAIYKILQKESPDVVHIHNLFPLISPSILPMINKTGIPIVMTVHNYRLVCPNGLFFSNNSICEKCTSGLKEINCITNNCEDSISKSIGYALRNYWARKNKYYLNNINKYLCLTEFQGKKLIANGFSEEKIEVIPNSYNHLIRNLDYKISIRKYVAFAGRISSEKGISILLEAARKLPDIPFRLAGKISSSYLVELDIPSNVVLVGMLNQNDLATFYEKARCFVLSSICYEGFPMVLPEAMAHKLPIVAPNMAGYPEIAEDYVNGFLFESGDANSLAIAIRKIWNRTVSSQKMAENNFRKVKLIYSSKQYYNQLVNMYQQSIDDKKDQ